MKKTIIVIWICFLSIIVTSCTPIEYQYDYNELNSDVISVELIYYDNMNSKIVSDFLGSAKHFNFFFASMKQVEIMEKEHYEGFFNAISAEAILNLVSHANSPTGLCIKMDYQNGDFDIISGHYCGRFSSDGTFQDFLGSWGVEEFIQFVNENFNIKIEDESEK